MYILPNSNPACGLSLYFSLYCIRHHTTTNGSSCVSRTNRNAVPLFLVFRDANTPMPFVEEFEHEGHPDDPEGGAAALADHIYMDAMGFGMGNSCLQVTFQARKYVLLCVRMYPCCIAMCSRPILREIPSIDCASNSVLLYPFCSLIEARDLYDQLATVCPIVLALSGLLGADIAVQSQLLSARDSSCITVLVSICRLHSCTDRSSHSLFFLYLTVTSFLHDLVLSFTVLISS